ncbi:MAG: hypothetical protein CSB33_01640 [Desulfobacterales bacterium]|nr:MAG: hypothetical protein CSB33_01640 [Desulfobacterales bacterium]
MDLIRTVCRQYTHPCLPILLFFFLFICVPRPAHAGGIPPNPALVQKIGGTISINGELRTQMNGGEIRVRVLHENGVPFDPPAETTGLLISGCYVLYIPLYDAASQPGGAKPDEILGIEIREANTLLLVTEPAGGALVINQDSPATQIVNISALQGPGGTALYTGEELNENVARWDADKDGKVSLPDAIHALQVVAGIP